MSKYSLFGLFVLFALTACPPPTPAPPAPKPPTHKFSFKNLCKEGVWVGSTGQNGSLPLEGGGWYIAAGDTYEVSVPVGHSGRIWPRTGCTFDDLGSCPAGEDCCLTGGCLEADNKTFGLKCGFTGAPPASLLEWTLDAASGNGPIDYYDMSFVDGWSVPLSMRPVEGSYNVEPDPGIGSWWCEQDGCTEGMPVCPDSLRVPGSALSCYSPCQVAVTAGSADAEKLCCTCSLSTPITCPEATCAGHYGCTPYHTPPYPADMVCNPWDTNPSRAWDAQSLSFIGTVREACPKVYSWQFDDMKATFNCRKTGGLVDYEVAFCPGIPAER